MDDDPVAVEIPLDFPPMFMRQKDSNPEDERYELWVIEEDGKQYYRHGAYKSHETMLTVANIVGRSRMFAEFMLNSYEP